MHHIHFPCSHCSWSYWIFSSPPVQCISCSNKYMKCISHVSLIITLQFPGLRNIKDCFWAWTIECWQAVFLAFRHLLGPQGGSKENWNKAFALGLALIHHLSLSQPLRWSSSHSPVPSNDLVQFVPVLVNCKMKHMRLYFAWSLSHIF